MANNEYAIRFSEIKYALKQEVSKELNLSLIDPLWSKILSYRSSFYSYLLLKSIDRSQLLICLNNLVNSNAEALNKKLINFKDEVNKLSSVNGDSRYYSYLSNLNILKTLNEYHKYDLLERDLKEIISDKNKPLGVANNNLCNYLNALTFISNNTDRQIDESYTADLYEVLTNQEELTYFYRMNDDNFKANSVQVGRIYASAPYNLIETLMSGLYDFILTSELDVINKALITYYYIDYVKPFSSLNEEMAVLLAKSILSNYLIKEKVILLPLEKLLTDRNENGAKYYNEVQKTLDLTYFVTYATTFFNKIIDKSINNMADLASYKANDIDNKPQAVNEANKEIKPEFNKSSNEEKSSEIKTQVNKVDIKNNKNNYERISLFDDEELDNKNVETKKEEKRTFDLQDVKNTQTSLAVSYIPEALDEKTARRLASHLLELDPELKKGEAKFYSRHCTLGKIYTIQQYKKEIGCVYETARTSMDHLCKLGYYQESMLKNKKVYTPVKRK